MTPADAYLALMLEEIPIRPTHPRGCHLGPTAQWLAEQAAQELVDVYPDDDCEAAS